KRFQNKVVIGTGATSGIRRAIMTAFVREGAKGIIVDIDREWAEMLAGRLRADGGDTLVCRTDITQADQVEAMIESVLRAYGSLDILVNNAGVGVHKRGVDVTAKDWD